jgi:O-antigen/teichoic acid export membrane protein
VTTPDDAPDQPEDASSSARSTSAIRSDAVRGTWWTAVNAVVGIPLSVIANLVVARSLGPEGFGTLASWMTAYSVILVTLSAGVSSATVQWGAAAYARGDEEEFLDLARRCAGLHMAVAALIGAVVSVVILDDQPPAIRLVAGLAVAISMALGAANVVLTAMAMNARLAILVLGVNVVIQAAVVTAAVTTGDPGPVWLARLVVAVMLSGIGLLLAPPLVRRACLTPVLKRPWPPGYASFSWKTMVSSLVGTLVFSRIEVLILTGYDDAVAAGLFALAAGFAVQITAPIDAMLGPLLPSAAALLAVDKDRAAQVVVRGLRLSAFITTAILVLAVPIVGLLTPLVYGRQFADAGLLFIALAITSCVQTVLHPVTAFSVALRRPFTVLAISLVALVFDLALVFALVSGHAALAATAGNCLGQVLALIGTVVLVQRVMKVPLRACTGSFMAFGINAAVTAAVTWWCIEWQQDGGGTAVTALVGTAVCVVASLAVLRLVPSTLLEEDVAPITRTFPRVTGPGLEALRRFGFITR